MSPTPIDKDLRETVTKLYLAGHDIDEIGKRCAIANSQVLRHIKPGIKDYYCKKYRKEILEEIDKLLRARDIFPTSKLERILHAIDGEDD